MREFDSYFHPSATSVCRPEGMNKSLVVVETLKCCMFEAIDDDRKSVNIGVVNILRLQALFSKAQNQPMRINLSQSDARRRLSTFLLMTRDLTSDKTTLARFRSAKPIIWSKLFGSSRINVLLEPEPYSLACEASR